MPEVTAVVPIREKSERLPRKNFRKFNGKPLYYWILDTLTSVEVVDRVVVNTNAKEIITRVPELFEVEISERPERFYGDSTTQNIIQYEVNRIDTDIYLQTFCTNPLLKKSSVSEAIKRYIKSDCDTLFTVTGHQKRMYTEDLEPINHDPHNRIPTQQLSPVYEDNSNIYLFSEKAIERKNDRIGESYTIYEIGQIESMDIDTKADFEMAEYFHKKREG